MCKKLVFLSFLLFLFAVSAQANLVAYYPFEGNANDMSGYGTVANGTLVGSPTFEAGPANFGQALKISTGNYVNCGADSKFSITGPITVCAWIKVNAWTTNWNAIVTKGDTTWRLHRNNATDNINFTCSGVNGGSATGTTNVRDGQWHHLAGVWDGANITLYVDGKVDGTAATTGGSTATTTLSMMIGENATYTGRPYDGWIDEVRIYNNALSAGEILAVMTGAKGLPSDPKPADKATEVPIDVGEISWTPGDFILADGGTHNVFFGTDETSVANAAIANTLGTTLYQGLDVNNVGLDQLEYGTTYYWRVDEVNIPSKPGTVKGNIWNFKTELEGYPLEPAQIINVTASENPVYPDEQEPNMTCNESGLDANDMHSTELATMWLGMADEPGQVWIQYEFDRVYKLHDMLVWNYNELPPGETYGAKDVNIAYSLDGETWTALGDTVTFNQATGDETCTANTAVGFDGAIAKYVKLVFLNSFEDGLYTGGVSEVRFSAIPTRPRNPVPANAAANIAVDALLSWKAGRDAAEHNLYIGTDVNAVKEGTASKAVLQDASYSPVLGLAKTYYWKVDEVNMAEEYTTWDGDVWSFSTAQAIVVDNFEVGYDDTDANAVWATWLDGYGNESVNGALMGYEFPGPYLSTTNINGGHSAPIRYNNTTAGYSEVKAQSEELPIGTVDWSLGSPKTLTIWFRGDPCNVVGDEELYCVVDGKRVVYGGDIANLGRDRWSQFDIDLSTLGVNLSDVDDIAIGIKKIGATGGSGVLLIDYIRLTGLDPVVVGQSIWIEAENFASVTPGLGLVAYDHWEAWNNGALAATSKTSGTGYIRTDPNVANDATAAPPTAGVVSYTFTVEGGQYVINGRTTLGFGVNNTYVWKDAFWVKVAGNNVTTNVPLNADGWAYWNNIPNAWVMGVGYAWAWDQIHNTTSSNANQDIIWTLPAGTYTLQVAYADRTTRLDVLEITKVGN